MREASFARVHLTTRMIMIIRPRCTFWDWKSLGMNVLRQGECLCVTGAPSTLALPLCGMLRQSAPAWQYPPALTDDSLCHREDSSAIPCFTRCVK
jgi:hypothetical protein